ncbi:MAG: hypothetical protein M3271_08575 [Actinomycetota bacterium]|nr:hypothetical protein [Actinomycetota bacterium]
MNERVLSVALLQSEREVLHTPGLDLSAFLASDPRWDAQLFTDRNFEGLAETATHFDCLVLGFNVLYLTESLRQMLQARPPGTGLVILHQLRSEALAFLPEDLRVGVTEVDARHDRVLTPLNRAAENEILLSWPEEVAVDEIDGATGLAGSAICYLDKTRPGRWRTVLEIEHEAKRMPVVVRTLRSVEHGVVICNLWLEPSRTAHAALLGNAIRYAALGFPEIAVVGESDGDGMDLLARKIRVQGTKVVQLRPGEAVDADPFQSWPLRDVSRAVVGRNQVVPPEWKEGGGTLIRVGESEELSITGGAPDATWVAQQWAAWFSATDPARWHGGTDKAGEVQKGSIFQSRGVLRVLDWMQREGRVARLKCPPPERYAGQLGMMIGLRIDPDGGVEGTISSTAAALDIHELAGGRALTEGSVAQLRAWLAKALQDVGEMSLADQLDVARCLKDRDALQGITRRLKALPRDDLPPGTQMDEEGRIALAPMIVSALRHACVAVLTPGDPDADVLLEGFVEDDVSGLGSNLLLAADYLYATASFTRRFPRAPLALGSSPDSSETSTRNLEQSISALGKYGHVARLGEDASEWRAPLNGEVVSTEALALIEFLSLEPAKDAASQAAIRNTHAVAFRDRGLPPIAVNQLIREVQSTRKELTVEHQKLTEAREELRTLARVRHLFGGIAVALSLLPVFLFIRANGFDIWGLAWLPAGAAVLAALWLLTKRLGLSPPWLDRAGEGALGVAAPAWRGVIEAIRKRKDEDPKDG